MMNCIRLSGLSYSRMKWFCRFASQHEVHMPFGCCQQGEENLPKNEKDFGKTLLDPSSGIQLDMDLGSRLADPVELQRNVKSRGMQHINIHKLARDYMQYKTTDTERRETEAKRLSIVEEIKEMRKAGYEKNDPDLNTLKRQGRELRIVSKQVEGLANEMSNRMALAALQLPNTLSSDTPEMKPKILKEEVGADISSNEHRGVSHIDIALHQNLIEFSNIGDQAFYFKGLLAVLEQTLQDDFNAKLTNNGFIPMTCPEMFRDNVLEGSGLNLDDNYKLNRTNDHVNVDHCIRGNSVSSFSAFLSRSVTETDALPQKFFTSGRSYAPKPEHADKHPGLFSTTQSVKTSALITCESGHSAEEHYKEGQTLLWELYTDYLSKYQISTRLVLVPACELERSEQGRTELQMWLPSVSQYVKVAYVSLLGDYISRRLTIRHSVDINDTKSSYPVHMVFAELLDVNKLTAILLEHGFD